MKFYQLSYVFFTTVLAFFLNACTAETLEEHSEGLPTAEKGKVYLELYTNTDTYREPVTRMGNANEDALGQTPFVLVFRGNSDNAVFFEVAQAIVVGDKSYVALTNTTQECSVIVIANPPVTFFNGVSEVPFDEGNLTSYLTAHPQLADAANGLLTAPLAYPIQSTVPYTSQSAPYPTIPMSGHYTLFSIEPGTTIGTESNKLHLERIVAKVTLEANNIPDFTLLSATVAYAPRSGRLYQWGATLRDNSAGYTDYLTSSTGDSVSGIAPATDGSTAANPIYLYESRKQDNTTVIIKADYKGTPYYYRLAFYERGTLFDIIRNKNYQFVIHDVVGEGYTTVEEAKTNPAMNMVLYDMIVTDQTSYDIMDNGQFYLGVTNSEYNGYGYINGASLTALTITTNANVSMPILTNSISITTISGTALSVSPSKITLASGNGTVATTDVIIPAPTSYATSIGTITIRLGSLIKTIKVQRSGPVSPLKPSIFLDDDCVSAKTTRQEPATTDWFSLSTASAWVFPGPTSFIFPDPTTLYANYWYFIDGPDPSRITEIYVNRSGQQGTIKYYIAQDKAATEPPPIRN